MTVPNLKFYIYTRRAQQNSFKIYIFGILGPVRIGAHKCFATTLRKLLMVLMVIPTTTAAQHITPDSVITRLNYGVIFRPQQPVRIVTDEWTHVFITRLPEPRNERQDALGPSEFNCTEIHDLSAASCKSFMPLFNTLLTLHKTSVRRVNTVINHIYSILPENKINRQTRGLFDIGGQILHSLFGVATNKQVDAIHATARRVITDNANAFHSWQKHAETMSSFMSVANQRLDNLANVVRDHQKLVQTVYQSMSRLDTDIVILRTVMLSAINNLTNFITVLNELDDVRIAIEDLVHGQLSPILLPPEILESALIDIHRMVTHQSSPYISIVLERVAARYYRMHNFVAARQGTNLLIAINFPLSADHLDLMLYQLQSFPVPVPGDHNVAHVTEITDLPYGVAFKSFEPDYEYLIFHSKPELTDNYFYFTHRPSEPLRLFSTHHTCISAILQNDRKLISQLCHFHLRPESLTPSILPLSPSSIFVTNISSLNFICHRQRTTAPGCLQCQMSIPCHCSIHTSLGFLPTRLSGCTPSGNNITVYHTVNLAVLQSFFDDAILGSLLGNTLLDQPLPVDLPAFQIFKANDSSRLAKDYALSYDLSRAVNITKAEGKVFHSLAETLWRDARTIDNNGYAQYSFTSWTNWPTLTLLMSLILALFALIGFIFLFYLVKILATTIATMHVTIHKTAALRPTLPTFISYFSPSSIANTSSTTWPLQTADITPLNSPTLYMFLMCIILLILLLYKKFRHCKSNPNSCSLLLEVGNYTDRLQIHCHTLPGSPSQYTFSASYFITSVDITGRFRKTANVK